MSEETKEKEVDVEAIEEQAVAEVSADVLELWEAYAKCAGVKANPADTNILRMLATGLLEFFLMGRSDEEKTMELVQFAIDATVNNRLKTEIKDFDTSLVPGTGGIICRRGDVMVTVYMFVKDQMEWTLMQGTEEEGSKLRDEFLDQCSTLVTNIYNDAIELYAPSATRAEAPIVDEETISEDDALDGLAPEETPESLKQGELK